MQDKELKYKIKKILSQQLPGATSHIKMTPAERELTAPGNNLSGIRHSSVLLPLFVENQTLFICLIKRPSNMKHHGGQIALPGGRIEKGETKAETALRETKEEIGINPDEIELLGQLSELYVEVSRFLIHPFVGWLDKKPNFIINKNEVEKTIIFPVQKLSEKPELIELKTVSGRLKVPCIKFENEIIWGATAMILSEFNDILKKSAITEE